MKSLFLRFKQMPRLSKKDYIIFFLPAVLWALVSLSRPYVLKAHCLDDEEKCSISELHPLDQPIVFFQSDLKDRWSFITMYTAAGVSVSIPIIYWGAQILIKASSPSFVFFSLGTDLVILTQTILWNGALMEFSRVFFQRPRPFVFRDIQVAGANPAHYTSFYSGHTSFVAAVSTATFLMLLTLFWKIRIILYFFSAYAIVITVATGLFRMLNGRHFFSDVVVATIMGFIIAVFLAWYHRSSVNSKSLKL